jgi:hypothetical protein
MTCRNSLVDIETGVEKLLRDESGGYLLTARVVSGMKVARARFRLWCRTWEPVVPMRWPVDRLGKGDPQAAVTVRG